MDRYLVTGGAGFIGSHIVEELVGRGEFVRVIDNLLTGKEQNLSQFRGKIEFIKGDIRDEDVCLKVLEGIDYVLHQAALPSVPRSMADPKTTSEININGTLNILLASREAGIKRMVFASSSSVYGDDPRLPKEEGQEGQPLSPYALSKSIGEKYCLLFNRIYGFPVVCLRYFNVFGPRQDPFSQYAAVIPYFITRLLEDKQIKIYGDGEQSRDFTFVKNVAAANLLALKIENADGEVFNIACGLRTTINTLTQELLSILQSRVRPVYDPPRPGDVKHSFADVSKAEKILNYKPLVTFKEGLEKTIQWYKGTKK